MQLATVSFEVEFPPDLLRLDKLILGELDVAADKTAEGMAALVRHKITTPDEDGRVIDSSHELLSSVEAEASASGDEITIEAWAEAAQAEWIEEGRPPGPVPVAPIIEWMLDKGITPRDGETLEQAAHAIARKIAREGYEGRHIFAETLEEADAIAIEQIDRAIERVNRRLS